MRLAECHECHERNTLALRNSRIREMCAATLWVQNRPDKTGSAGSAAECHGMHQRCIQGCGCRAMPLNAMEGRERRRTPLYVKVGNLSIRAPPQNK